MPTFGEELHTGIAQYQQANPFLVALTGYWKLDEPVGSTILKNSAAQSSGAAATNGTPVGDVVLGQGSLIKQDRQTSALLGIDGGYISIPDDASLDNTIMSVGLWFRPLVDMVPLQSLIFARFDELSGSVAANEGYAGAGTYFNGPAFNQLGAIPGRTGTAVKLDGIDEYISFPHHVDLRLNDGFLISWFGAHAAYGGGDRYVLSKNDDTSSAGYSVRRTGGSTFVFRRNNQEYSFTAPGGASMAAMHHYAVWYDDVSQTLRWVYDGIVQATFTGVTFPDSAGGAAFEVGRSPAGTNYEIIAIDNLVVYALHPVFHPSFMTLKRIVDTSQGLVINFPTGQYYGFISKDNAYGLVWNTFVGGGALTFEVWIGAARHIAEVGNQQLLNTETYFLSGSYNGATLRLHKNGVELDNTATGGGSIDTNASPLEIGRTRGSNLVRGTFDEVILFAAPIMDAGVTGWPLSLYTAGITERTAIECPPKPTPHRERVIYIRPDIVGNLKYILHTPPSRAILSEEGFGTPPLKYVTDRAPFQHGDTVRSFHLEPRQVQLVVMHNFDNRAAYQNGRAELLSLLRPNALQQLGSAPALSPERQGKLLCYLGNGAKRQLDVLLDSGPGFAPPQGGWREWSFTEVLRFTAHNPLWYDPTQQEVEFGLETSELFFPIEFPLEFTDTSFTAEVAYGGDWPEYPSFEVVGPITSPHIHNHATDKMIELATSIPAGYSLLISLGRPMSITRSDGLSLLGYVSGDSDLTDFTLEPDPVVPNGLNHIHIYGTGLTASTKAYMRWYNRYIGI